jgi:hypothetical protein
MIGNIKGINTSQIINHMNSINPQEVLANLGYEGTDAEQILKGDMSPIIDKSQPLLDMDSILKFHGQHFNRNLIQYFYEVPKANKQFTEDEVINYKEIYDAWFELVFRVGQTFIFQIDEESEDLSLLIKVNGEYYQMSIVEDANIIVYIGENIN